MNRELTKKLIRRFPVLYQGYYDSPMQSLLCFGFECGAGWFDIIWQLSLAIEEELGYTWYQKRWFLFKKWFFRHWNNVVYYFSPPRKADWLSRLLPPKKWVMQGKVSTTPSLGLKKLVVHPYTGFAVQQVKEKYGSLCFYSPSTDRIDSFIRLAERLSVCTCENCGKSGKTRSTGWYYTRCNECWKKEHPDYVEPKEEEQECQ